MSRPQRAKRYTPDTYSPTSSMGVEQYGISVFRSVGSPLDDALKVVSSSFGIHLLRERGKGPEKPLAVSLLELEEARRICYLGSVAISEASDALYCQVPTLHNRLEVTTAGVDLFGRRFITDIAIGITLEDDDLLGLSSERSQILEILQGMTPPNPNDHIDRKLNQAHISLGRISRQTPDEVIDNGLENIKEALPQHIVLKRATIYNPHHLYSKKRHL